MYKSGFGKKVTFIHPDLGIGGAERLIVDAAVGLQRKGYNVSIITGYHDTKRAFPETVNGSLKVIKIGSWIPRSINGRLVALFAYFKMIYAALYLILISGIHPNYVICDQVSACIPFLRFKLFPWLARPKILFYCHFPDQLLTERISFLKKLYRWPLDWFEQFTTGLADKICVNSDVFKKTFKTIKAIPDILYPSINTKGFDEVKTIPSSNLFPRKYKHVFLSINRFEPKKNIQLAVHSLRKLKTCLEPKEWENFHLYLAGGYDPRLQEAVKYLDELKELVQKEKIEEKVTFVLSPSDQTKIGLLSHCTGLLYTPSNEHFGIVPLEAMYMGKPVIAVNSGGPKETVVDEVTGFLVPNTEIHFAVSMARLIKDEKLAKSLGAAGKIRFSKLFSFESFQNSLEATLISMDETPKKSN